MVLLSEASIFSTQKIGYPGTVTLFSPFPLNALRPHIGYQESSEPFCIGRVKQVDPFSFSCHVWCAGWSEEIFLILPCILEGNEKLVKGLLLSWGKILATMLEQCCSGTIQFAMVFICNVPSLLLSFLLPHHTNFPSLLFCCPSLPFFLPCLLEHRRISKVTSLSWEHPYISYL